MLSRTTKIASLVLAVVLLALSALPAMASGSQKKTLLDVALEINQETGEFSILIAAVQAADPMVAKALSGSHQLTVFAPTDAAFQSLLAELGVSAEQLLGDRKLVKSCFTMWLPGGWWLPTCWPQTASGCSRAAIYSSRAAC